MNLYELNSAAVAKELGVAEVPDAFLAIAKHQIMGMDNESIAQVMGADGADIVEVEKDSLYQQVKGFVGGIYAEQSAKQTTGWDAIEQTAIDGLMKRLPYEKDSEFLLKVAAVANRATRKHDQKSNVLDPMARGGRTTITLTQRLVSKMNSRGGVEQEQTRQLSISDGSMSNPNFQEIDSLLNVRNSPALPHATEIRTRNVEPTEDELLGDLLERQPNPAGRR